MQILIVGIGALSGIIASRAIRSGLPVRLVARNTDSTKALPGPGGRRFKSSLPDHSHGKLRITFNNLGIQLWFFAFLP